jgi:hypothetical protein
VNDDDDRGERYVAYLRSLGATPGLCCAFAVRTYPRKWRRGVAWFSIVAGVISITSIGVVGSTICMLDSRLADALAEGSYFVDHSGAWVIIFPLCAAVLCPAPLLYYVERCLPMRVRELFFLVSLEHAHLRWILRRALRESRTPEQLVEASSTLTARFLGWGCVAFAVLSAIFVPLEMASYTRGTREGLEMHSLFGVERVPWRDVDAVEVGCTAGAARYEIIAGARRTGAFPSAIVRGSTGSIVELDRRLRAQGVPIRRAVFPSFTWRSGEPMWDAGCVEAATERSGMDEATLAAMLTPSAGR